MATAAGSFCFTCLGALNIDFEHQVQTLAPRLSSDGAECHTNVCPKTRAYPENVMFIFEEEFDRPGPASASFWNYAESSANHWYGHSAAFAGRKSRCKGLDLVPRNRCQGAEQVRAETACRSGHFLSCPRRAETN